MNTQSSHQSDPRKRSRVDVSFNIQAQCSGRDLQVQTENISLKGVLCFPNPGLSMGDVCELVIVLDAKAKIDVQSEVVRADKESVAFDFLKMDEESFHHLYNLVRLNSEDAEAIEDELRFPAFDIPFSIYERPKKK